VNRQLRIFITGMLVETDLQRGLAKAVNALVHGIPMCAA
jgi:hypothetical protein